jgi:phage N-6-adenine-methyltransferase
MNAVYLQATHATPSGEDWETPPDVFRPLELRYRFGLDAAATAENRLALNFFTKQDDALKQSWGGYGNVFCNPPYGRGLGAWMRKARAEAMQHGVHVVCLVPATPGVRWWQDYVLQRDGGAGTFVGGQCEGNWRRLMHVDLIVDITELPGRVRFLQPGRESEGATRDSAVVVFLGMCR